MIGAIVLAAVLAAAGAVGVVVRARSGKIRERRSAPGRGPSPELVSVGVGAGVPVVLHFAASWCGPCAAVRRVVARVVEDVAATGGRVLDVEVDFDENAALAQQLGVMSLPTTFLFDGRGVERFRVSGVPAASDLARAVTAL